MRLSTRLSAAFDPHVAGIAAIALVLVAMLPFPWVPWLVAVLPVGRLATRACDLRRSGHSPLPHVLVNGAVLAVLTGLGFLLSAHG